MNERKIATAEAFIRYKLKCPYCNKLIQMDKKYNSIKCSICENEIIVLNRSVK